MQAFNGPSCKVNKAKQNKADNAYVNDANANKPDYFRSSIKRVADKRASQVLRNKIQNEFIVVFVQEVEVLKVHLFYRSRMKASC